MTTALTVRLDDESAQQLAELAEHHRSRSAAVQDAIHRAWKQLQADKLEAGYAAAIADNPHYPYESAEEAATLRARRRSRDSGDSVA
jgi:predicted transcriptional regulator